MCSNFKVPPGKKKYYIHLIFQKLNFFKFDEQNMEDMFLRGGVNNFQTNSRNKEVFYRQNTFHTTCFEFKQGPEYYAIGLQELIGEDVFFYSKSNVCLNSKSNYKFCKFFVFLKLNIIVIFWPNYTLTYLYLHNFILFISIKIVGKWGLE